MLLVIFGAGASYDSVPFLSPAIGAGADEEFRPPLAKDLFGPRQHFLNAMRGFPKMRPIVPWLAQMPGVSSVERVLQDLQDEATDYPERHCQLAAVRYYLQLVLWGCDSRWNDLSQGVSNYTTLLDQIRRWRKPQDQVCLVTFNYDRLLEKAMTSVGMTINSISDYVSHDVFKVIKLHGSVHWAREVDSPVSNLRERNSWDIANELIERVGELKISDRYRLVTEHPISKAEDVVLFPALAIPTESKRDFECPNDHVEVLQDFLPKVSKILVIGWRATEKPFLQMLTQYLKQGVQVFIVAGSVENAREPEGSLRSARITGTFSIGPWGFTEFIRQREADAFLRT